MCPGSETISLGYLLAFSKRTSAPDRSTGRAPQLAPIGVPRVRAPQPGAPQSTPQIDGPAAPIIDHAAERVTGGHRILNHRGEVRAAAGATECERVAPNGVSLALALVCADERIHLSLRADEQPCAHDADVAARSSLVRLAALSAFDHFGACRASGVFARARDAALAREAASSGATSAPPESAEPGAPTDAAAAPPQQTGDVSAPAPDAMQPPEPGSSAVARQTPRPGLDAAPQPCGSRITTGSTRRVRPW